MRIALLTWDYPPAPTGLGRAADEIANGLVDQGTDVTVFTMDRAGTSSDRPGLSIVGLADQAERRVETRKLAAAGHLVAPGVFAQGVRQVAEREPFDLIEATNWYAPGLFLTTGRVPVVIRNSTPAGYNFRTEMNLRDRVDLGFAHWLEARATKQAAALISNAPHHRAEIEQRYGLAGQKPHEIIGLSLSEERLAAGRAAPPPPRGERMELCFVGRAERRKGFGELLSAINILRREQKVRLRIIGISEEELSAAITESGLPADLAASVTALGRVSDEEQNEVFATSDAVIAPSRYESFGLVYREAAAFGRPLIACREDPSARDLLNAEPFGILSADCGGEALAAATRELFADDDRFMRMSEHGRAYAQGLSRANLGRRTLAVYEKVLRSRGRPLVAA